MAFQGDSIYWVEVEKVVPNPFQPRREFDEHKLRELGDSIRMYGVLQPLTVTRKEVQREDGTFFTEYELIAGERRLRASKLAGVPQVPVIIRDGEQTEQEKLELAIIENLQREDLNAVDRALAFKQLAEQFKLSHVQVAEKVGRSREYVSNSIRLLALPDNILEALKVGNISEGHARTLLMLNDRPEEQQVVFEEAQLKKLSVRDVERIARGIATDKVRKKTLGEMDHELLEMEKKFTETLGTRVQIQKTDFGGRVAIDYFTVEDLESILARIKEVEEEAARESEAVLKELVARTPLETTTSTPKVEPERPPSVEPAAQTYEMKQVFHTPNQSTGSETDTLSSSEIDGVKELDEVEMQDVHTPKSQSTPTPVSTLAHTMTDSDQIESPKEEVILEQPTAEERMVAENTTESTAKSEEIDEAHHEDVQPSSTPAHDDDSNLYSIRNFTV
jgi:ParB family chromosome partitioning protein